MRILVTGGGGSIGRHAVDHLVRNGHDVTAVLRRPATLGALRPASRVVSGDAADVALMMSLTQGMDAVLHLAAIPAPIGYTARELLVANSNTTITVLEAAGENHVKGVVIASSISALGLVFNERFTSPAYLPVDEAHPLWPSEGYALSKECDEAAARMAARRWEMPVIALRFPYTQSADEMAVRALDPGQFTSFAKELWAYLDLRDAARACELAIRAAATGEVEGSVVLNVMADDVLLDRSLAELVAQWHPGLSPLPADYPFVGAYDTSAAARVIGFTAEHLLEHGPVAHRG